MILDVHVGKSSHHQRHASGSSPSYPISPTDSGYGSSPTTPLTLRQLAKDDGRPLADEWARFVGNESDSDDPFGEADLANTPGNGVTHHGSPWPQTRPATQTPRTTRYRPTFAASLYPRSGSRIQQRGANKSIGRPGVGFLRRPDRFIPARPRQVAELSERFKTGKAPHELTGSERLLRHSGATEDPFYRRRNVEPMTHQFRSQSRSGTTGSRNRVSNVLGPLDQNSAIDDHTGNSTVWTVRDVPFRGTAVNDGRGQLVASGTNARLFRTIFPTALKAEEELEKHKARLAAALGLDRVQRILDVSIAPCREENFSISSKSASATQWNGSEWVKEGPVRTQQKPPRNRELPLSPFK
ncbi:hypothetical protein MFIFM68171_03618 [Madurella fahalii]|uniref:Uncharacterized protein n=1 Tax=Madurella fahalii TaxID=1157608 RepID=A0ABQ0G6M0_9PEZI